MADMVKRDLGTVIRKLRTKRKWTQEQLAERAGLTRSYITLMESGKRGNPSLPAVKALAKALGVSVGDLLE